MVISLSIMRLYDVVLVMRSSVTGTAREKLLDAIKKWLGSAKVAKVDDWGKKPLAYPIKKETEGNYVLLNVETEEGLKGDFEKRLLIEEAVLRHLVLRKD